MFYSTYSICNFKFQHEQFQSCFTICKAQMREKTQIITCKLKYLDDAPDIEANCRLQSRPEQLQTFDIAEPTFIWWQMTWSSLAVSPFPQPRLRTRNGTTRVIIRTLIYINLTHSYIIHHCVVYMYLRCREKLPVSQHSLHISSCHIVGCIQTLSRWTYHTAELSQHRHCMSNTSTLSLKKVTS